ncbi:histidine kinase [Conexibacter stalactiti]|uniref:histidine kinase n=1 Tax=Conexibacter stalactiti TaxID=1940611 RepID=A0ABU4HZR3_9ACTN|nr:histidine kinase [Conexibacter stalactiti]MDW5598793.1 histidine kinase [Conexibacter stalactiti]MEC5039435.1 histidine kinase [Conexibacter stalactiti]
MVASTELDTGPAVVAQLHDVIAVAMARIRERATAARTLVGFDDAAALAATTEIGDLALDALGDVRRLIASLPSVACRELADDVHDTLGHSLSLAALLAGGARARLEREPALAREALGRVAALAGETGAELETLLAEPLRHDPLPLEQPAATRDPRAAAAAQPAPLAGVAALMALAVDQPVTFAVDGVALAAAPRPLAAVAYRIVQESLTNARRHAPEAPVHVRVEVVRGALGVTVVNAPARTAACPPGSGCGIPGMHRRAAAAGGLLSAGPTPGGGFRVDARLPL